MGSEAKVSDQTSNRFVGFISEWVMDGKCEVIVKCLFAEYDDSGARSSHHVAVLQYHLVQLY